MFKIPLKYQKLLPPIITLESQNLLDKIESAIKEKLTNKGKILTPAPSSSSSKTLPNFSTNVLDRIEAAIKEKLKNKKWRF